MKRGTQVRAFIKPVKIPLTAEAGTPEKEGVARLDARLREISQALKAGAEADGRIEKRLSAVSADLGGLMTTVQTLVEQIGKLSGVLEGMNSELLNVDGGLGKINRTLHIERVTHCPQCGSTVDYIETNDGEMGECVACDWMHFLDRQP